MRLYIKNFILWLLLAFISLGSWNAFAKKSKKYKANDPMLVESGKCVTHFRKIERKNSMPRDLLYSISIQETGRYHKKSGKRIPWPWTVNHGGKGYYFKNKSEAVSFVKKQMRKGGKNIDVGCMQISMFYHKKSFKSVSSAFDPKTNITYAGKLLKQKYKKTKSWKKSVALYHSADKKRGKNYQKSVQKVSKTLKKNKFNYRKPRLKDATEEEVAKDYVSKSRSKKNSNRSDKKSKKKSSNKQKSRKRRSN